MSGFDRLRVTHEIGELLRAVQFDPDTGRTVPDEDRRMVGVYLASKFYESDEAIASLIEAHLPGVARDDVDTFGRRDFDERLNRLGLRPLVGQMTEAD